MKSRFLQKVNSHYGAKIPFSSYVNVFRTLKSGQLTQGKQITILETEIAKISGWKHAIAISSGTAALHVCLQIVKEVSKKPEVVVPAFSFVATANSVVIAGLKPMFADTEPNSFLSSSSALISSTSENSAAVIAVHEFGAVMDYSELEVFCREKDVFLIHDAACAIGLRISPSENEKTFVIYSFHPRKLVTSGEGGMILTNDDTYATRVRSLINHGFLLQDGLRTLVDAGFNYRMSDISAAVLNPQIRKLSRIILKRRKRFLFMASKISNPKLFLPYKLDTPNNFQTLTVMLKNNESESFLDYMQIHGIKSFKPAQFIPAEQFYNHQFSGLNALFPNSYQLSQQIFSIPFSERISKKEMRFLVNVINSY